MHFGDEVFVVVSGLLVAYGVFSYVTYRRYNPSRLWVPAVVSAAYTVLNIDGWLSWPAVVVSVCVFLSWMKHGDGIDTGYRVIADVTSGRFGVPNQEPCQPSIPAPEGFTPDAEEGINGEMPRFDDPLSWFGPDMDDLFSDVNGGPTYDSTESFVNE